MKHDLQQYRARSTLGPEIIQKFELKFNFFSIYRNSHFVELSTISEDNEQNSSEKNATRANGDILHMIVADSGSEYISDSSQMVSLLNCTDSGLVNPITSSSRLDERIIDVNKLTNYSESAV